jgi:hypothetical protein
VNRTNGRKPNWCSAAGRLALTLLAEARQIADSVRNGFVAGVA